MISTFEKRIDTVRGVLQNDDEAAVITNEVNIGYFTDFFHSEGLLLITAGKAVLLVDFRYHEAASEKAKGCEVVCFSRLGEELSKLLSDNGVANVIFEAENMTYARYDSFKTKFAEHGIDCVCSKKLDQAIADSRVIKYKSELDKIITAQKIAEKSYLDVLNFIRPGRTEREIAARLQYMMRLNGAEDVSFSLITITGTKTSLPHGVPGSEAIQEGDFFTCDFGAMYEGYHSDTTRTVAVGSVTEEMREVYDIVLRAQLAALNVIKPGVKCSNVDRAARTVIERAGYGKYFGHSTGHGVGLDIHEAPAVSSRCDTELKLGMVITDEPGIYLPGKFGVRIEDMLSVTDDGFCNFVSLPKELVVL